MSLAIICLACLLAGGATYFLITRLVKVTPYQDDDGHPVREVSLIRHDYKDRAASKQSNEFDAGVLTGAAGTLIIIALLLAFTSPANADVFIDFGLSMHRQVPLPAQTLPGYRLVGRYDIPETRNPYGVLSLGYQQPLNRHFNLSIALRHESSVPVRDCGTDSLQLTVRWALGNAQ